MTEDNLRNYFEEKATAEELKKGLTNSVFNGGNSVRVKIKESSQPDEFTVTIKHLLKLLIEVIEDKLTTEELSTISFCLESSDHFIWDNTSPAGERIAQLLSSWASPEINSELTREYLQYCAYYLETGEHR